MLFDYVLRNGRIAGGSADPVDVGVSDGRIAVIAPGSAMSARDGSRDIAFDARLMIPGFVETHIHLDKSCISDRCKCVTGTLQEAIAAAAAAKRDFTEQDIYERASRTLEKAIVQGTTRMRTNVEVDPRIGMKAFMPCAGCSGISPGRSIWSCAMVTTLSARLMNLRDYGIAVGNPADIVVLDCLTSSAAVAELAQPLLAMRRGRIISVFRAPPP